MSWRKRLQNVFRPERLDDEIEAEMQYHLAETVDRLVADGMDEKDAIRHARLRLGNYVAHKEHTRDMNLLTAVDSTRADLLYGVRQLRLNPGFTAVAVLSLALGIGANTALFQLVNAIRFQSLPIHNPQELVLIDFEKGAARSGWWSTRNASMTWSQWALIRSEQQAFSGVLAWSAGRFNLTTGGEPRYAEGLFVSGNFFSTLGVDAMIGRTLTPEDDTASCNAVAVLSHAFWQREFGGDPAVLGRTVSLGGHRIPVAGVTRPEFFGVEVGSRYDVAIPLCADRLLATDNKGRMPVATGWWLSAMGRLKPGWTLAAANEHLHTLSPGIMRATLPPEYEPGFAKRYLANRLGATEAGKGISPLRQEYERSLWLLMATAAVVLLIACANLANLLLARAAVREREIAVRIAIGASRWRVFRQLLAESLLLAGAGAAVGIGLAATLSRALVMYISTTVNPVFVNVELDWRVMAFTGTLALLTCMLFGLLPALRATQVSPASGMRSGGRSVTAGRERFGIRRALVSMQVALSLVLLVGAMLFVRSLQNLMTADAGFRAEGVLGVNIDYSTLNVPKERRLALNRELSDRLSALAGVISAAEVGSTPVSGNGWDQNVGPDGARAAQSGKVAFFNRAAPGYFRTMNTRLLAGRDFDDRDTLTAPRVAIVNEMFARKYFGGANPVGHTFHMDVAAGKPEPLFQVVGMVANTKYHNLREEFPPAAFFPAAQNEAPEQGATFVLRVAGSQQRVIDEAKAAVASVGSTVGIEFRPFAAQLADSLSRERLMATLSGAFGVLAGVLATLGLYGVVAYMVERRRSEIGVRLALGAAQGNVIRLVVKEAMILLGMGLVAGLALSLWAARTASTLLFGLQPHDTLSFGAACALLTVTALAASYVPARRAAAIAPVTALRND